ncbi:putative short-chain dehydrogenase reductase protein [Diplogelasinospora grovesii]|uniref:Short-chain dehydrogenase reductase protein n=1 Tax=Diplogelasinospora grovesii TaxID=303347 RepID=A0AAN6S4P0_9PEZI|nr:putative short-chain dehydrogenase reductase protein [Diplogelasinospora grovesii]
MGIGCSMLNELSLRAAPMQPLFGNVQLSNRHQASYLISQGTRFSHFARLNARRIILGCRDLQKDLASFASVKRFCQRAEDQLDSIDVFVANAGIQTAEFEVAEGYERQIAVNVLSTFLMTLLLLPVLRRSRTTTHVTIVASNAHKYVTALPQPPVFEGLKGADNMMMRYGTSKLLVVLAARELAQRMDATKDGNVILNMVDPGLCKSQLFREARFPVSWILGVMLPLVGRTAEMGCRALVAAASADASTHGGEGAAAQKRVFEELMGILPGISRNIITYI